MVADKIRGGKKEGRKGLETNIGGKLKMTCNLPDGKTDRQTVGPTDHLPLPGESCI